MEIFNVASLPGWLGRKSNLIRTRLDILFSGPRPGYRGILLLLIPSPTTTKSNDCGKTINTARISQHRYPC